MPSFELADLCVRAPAAIAVAGIPQVEGGDPVEAAPRAEARRPLVGQRLMVHEAVRVGGTDGLFVKVLRLEDATFDPRDLGASQRRAILERGGAVLRPDRELAVVAFQRRQVLRLSFRRRLVPGAGVR